GDPDRALLGHVPSVPRIAALQARVARGHARRGGVRAARRDDAQGGRRPPRRGRAVRARRRPRLLGARRPETEHDIDFFVKLEVAAVTMPVASLDDVMVTKLLALNEQESDFGGCLEIARSLREQIDWDWVRERTADAPFAAAFFTLVEELGVVRAT